MDILSKDEKISTKKPHHILLVEDDATIQRYNQYELEALGFIVDIAKDGLEALALYLNGYDLILMDCGLPKIKISNSEVELDGLEVSKRIRRHEHTHKLQATPIIMLTAFPEETFPEGWKDIGINKVVMKPVIGREKLADLILPWL
jgi:CheY-like chemotaxis protein